MRDGTPGTFWHYCVNYYHQYLAEKELIITANLGIWAAKKFCKTTKCNSWCYVSRFINYYHIEHVFRLLHRSNASYTTIMNKSVKHHTKSCTFGFIIQQYFAKNPRQNYLCQEVYTLYHTSSKNMMVFLSPHIKIQ